jgi:hypothetical protein
MVNEMYRVVLFSTAVLFALSLMPDSPVGGQESQPFLYRRFSSEWTGINHPVSDLVEEWRKLTRSQTYSDATKQFSINANLSRVTNDNVTLLRLVSGKYQPVTLAIEKLARPHIADVRRVQELQNLIPVSIKAYKSLKLKINNLRSELTPAGQKNKLLSVDSVISFNEIPEQIKETDAGKLVVIEAFIANNGALNYSGPASVQFTHAISRLEKFRPRWAASLITDDDGNVVQNQELQVQALQKAGATPDAAVFLYEHAIIDSLKSTAYTLHYTLDKSNPWSSLINDDTRKQVQQFIQQTGDTRGEEPLSGDNRISMWGCNVSTQFVKSRSTRSGDLFDSLRSTQKSRLIRTDYDLTRFVEFAAKNITQKKTPYFTWGIMKHHGIGYGGNFDDFMVYDASYSTTPKLILKNIFRANTVVNDLFIPPFRSWVTEAINTSSSRFQSKGGTGAFVEGVTDYIDDSKLLHLFADRSVFKLHDGRTYELHVPDDLFVDNLRNDGIWTVYRKSRRYYPSIISLIDRLEQILKNGGTVSEVQEIKQKISDIEFREKSGRPKPYLYKEAMPIRVFLHAYISVGTTLVKKTKIPPYINNAGLILNRKFKAKVDHTPELKPITTSSGWAPKYFNVAKWGHSKPIITFDEVTNTGRFTQTLYIPPDINSQKTTEMIIERRNTYLESLRKTGQRVDSDLLDFLEDDKKVLANYQLKRNLFENTGSESFDYFKDDTLKPVIKLHVQAITFPSESTPKQGSWHVNQVRCIPFLKD